MNNTQTSEALAFAILNSTVPQRQQKIVAAAPKHPKHALIIIARGTPLSLPRGGAGAPKKMWGIEDVS